MGGPRFGSFRECLVGILGSIGLPQCGQRGASSFIVSPRVGAIQRGMRLSVYMAGPGGLLVCGEAHSASIQDCTVLRSIPPCREMARDDMMIVMSECVEYQRLQHAYEDAIVVWEQDRHPNVRPINREKLTSEEFEKLRDQALLKRNTAANDLYIHLKTCPTCNHFKK
jgi:hypothetical protein